jgi:PIN domain nuclease of toxin-antitoxin system
VLLDTQVLLWFLGELPQLTAATAETIRSPDAQVHGFAVSAFEAATTRARGKLDAPEDLPRQNAAHGFTELPVTVEHGHEVRRLPFHHRDPFDRLLIARARVAGLKSSPPTRSSPPATCLSWQRETRRGGSPAGTAAHMI